MPKCDGATAVLRRDSSCGWVHLVCCPSCEAYRWQQDVERKCRLEKPRKSCLFLARCEEQASALHGAVGCARVVVRWHARAPIDRPWRSVHALRGQRIRRRIASSSTEVCSTITKQIEHVRLG
jgi:hypothetical protein